jgi:NAD(P)-dependent dehydrogenase (short-subunit alcohol dehydrogenase family)
VISSRKAEACAEAADAINAKHGDGTAIVVPANISSKEALQALADETRRQLGRIDILVCNAASNPYYGPMAGITDDQFRKILDNNIVANHWLISMVAPEMVERGDGSIIIISSIGGLTSSTMIGAYNISRPPTSSSPATSPPSSAQAASASTASRQASSAPISPVPCGKTPTP